MDVNKKRLKKLLNFHTIKQSLEFFSLLGTQFPEIQSHFFSKAISAQRWRLKITVQCCNLFLTLISVFNCSCFLIPFQFRFDTSNQSSLLLSYFHGPFTSVSVSLSPWSLCDFPAFSEWESAHRQDSHSSDIQKIFWQTEGKVSWEAPDGGYSCTGTAWYYGCSGRVSRQRCYIASTICYLLQWVIYCFVSTPVWLL